MKAWLVPYERICRGSAYVEAPTAEEAEALVRGGDFEPDSGEEQVDWSTAGPAKEEKP